jgi:hypothetical protein
VVAILAVASVLGYMQLTASAGGLTVTPHDGLPSGADVEVSGAGFAANQPGDVVECVDAAGTVGACVAIGSFETDGDGNFGPVPVTVEQSYLASDGTPVDCLPDDNCVVATSLDLSIVAPISFSAFGPTTTTTSTTSTTTTTTTEPSTTTTEPTTTTSTSTTTTTTTEPPTTTSTSTTEPTTTTSTSTTTTTEPPTSTTEPTTTTSTSTTTTTEPPTTTSTTEPPTTTTEPTTTTSTTTTSTTTTSTTEPSTTTTEPTTTTSTSTTTTEPTTTTTSVPGSPLCSLAQGLAPVPLVGLVFSVLEPVFCGL